MSVSHDEFRAALGRFASGITVVTSHDAAGNWHGITVSAFSSVSLDPPLVSVCIDRNTISHQAIAKSGVFVVNVLADGQEILSRHFSSPLADKFDGIAYELGIDGVPVLSDTLASLECRVTLSHDGGDHSIFLGEVERVRIADGSPLLYFRGGYARLVP